MGWSSKTKPTPANIRKRVSAAQDAVAAAIDLLKQNERFWPNDKVGHRNLKPLLQADLWLVDAQRKLGAR